MHIVHLIGSLERGGAELFLQRLVSGLSRLEPTWTQEVWTIGAAGVVAPELERGGVPVRAFGVTKSARAVGRGLRLVGAIDTSPASLLQTWMYHADAVGIAAYLTGCLVPQVWTLRQSNLSAEVNRRETRALIAACAWASNKVPRAIVAGSKAALDAHRAWGYDAPSMPVIHNGVDTERFDADEERRQATRARWGVDDNTLVFGYLANVLPVKAHDVLLAAVSQLAAHGGPPWRLVLVGAGASPDTPRLAELVAQHGLSGRVVMAGPTDRPEDVIPAFDVAVSSSLGEGFPNALAEAMTCQVPVVATDVGDTRRLVDTTGTVVTAGDASALGRALAAMLDEPRDARRERGRLARTRIASHFSEAAAVSAYAALYRAVVAR